MPATAPSPRTQIRRQPQRGHYDFATVAAIVDAALICHVAFRHAGSVHSLPTACWRIDRHLYVHAANNARMADALLADECAVSIALVDGLVLARSAFHHSMNYRSLAVYGQFAEVLASDDKAAALTAFVEHVSPGRSSLVRAPTPAELAGTRVLRLALDEAAAKIRNWGVEDDAGDLGIAVWAGVVPLHTAAGVLLPDENCAALAEPALPDLVVLRAE